MRNHEELRGATRSHEEPWGAPRSPKEPWAATRSPEEPRGAMKSYEGPWGAMRSYERPWGAMRSSWLIQTVVHTFQTLSSTCTLNTGSRLFRMSKRILVKHKSTKLKVSAAKNHLRGILTFTSRKNRGSEMDTTAWLQGQSGLSLHCAAEMLEPGLLSILITDYFTSQKSISQSALAHNHSFKTSM